MKKTILFSFLAAILMSGCTIEDRLERREDRLVGQWVFERAFYKDDNDLFRDDLTHQYEGDILEFFDDYFVIYEDWQTNEVFFGDWRLHAYRTYYDDDDDVDFLLDMEFFDENDRLAFAYFSSVTRLTNQKLHFTVSDRRGVYEFRLRKR